MIKAGRYELTEASLGRIYQHIVSKPKVKNWGVVTASRGENTPAENARRNKQLEDDLRKMNYGFIHVDGMWRECKIPNTEYKDCPDDMKVPTQEKSYFIPNISKEDVKALGAKYEQDSVLFADEETKAKGEATYIDSKSGKETNIGKFSPNRISQGYSKMKGGKYFTFLEPGDKGEAPKEEPKKPKGGDMKLKSMIPTGAANDKIKNPETGRMIKVKTALSYDKSSPAYKAAVSKVKR